MWAVEILARRQHRGAEINVAVSVVGLVQAQFNALTGRDAATNIGVRSDGWAWRASIRPEAVMS